MDMGLKDGIVRVLKRINAVQVFGFGLGLRPAEDSEDSTTASVQERLLRLLWDYPLLGDAEASWAVKESSVLRGELGAARERPGLGVSIVTADLALRAFGNRASDRIDLCVSWGLGRRQKVAPFYILGEQVDPVTSEIVLKPDFRHTLAFALVLQITGRCHELLVQYVDTALDTQRPNGDWSPGSGMTVSEVFTVLYAAELLHRVSSTEMYQDELRRRARSATTRALDWLANNRGQDHLWKSGVLKDYKWDGLFATAWVLSRLCEVAGEEDRWRIVVEESLRAMLGAAMDPATWASSAPEQRSRVEARVAAAAAKVSRCAPCLGDARDLAQTYVAAWRPKAERWVASLGADELDVSTAVFLLEGMLRPEELQSMGREIAGANPELSEAADSRD